MSSWIGFAVVSVCLIAATVLFIIDKNMSLRQRWADMDLLGRCDWVHLGERTLGLGAPEGTVLPDRTVLVTEEVYQDMSDGSRVRIDDGTIGDTFELDGTESATFALPAGTVRRSGSGAVLSRFIIATLTEETLAEGPFVLTGAAPATGTHRSRP